MNFVVKRLPSLPQIPPVRFRTRNEAENWIANQMGKDYNPDAYYIEDMNVSAAKD